MTTLSSILAGDSAGTQPADAATSARRTRHDHHGHKVLPQGNTDTGAAEGTGAIQSFSGLIAAITANAADS